MAINPRVFAFVGGLWPNVDNLKNPLQNPMVDMLYVPHIQKNTSMLGEKNIKHMFTKVSPVEPPLLNLLFL